MGTAILHKHMLVEGAILLPPDLSLLTLVTNHRVWRPRCPLWSRSMSELAGC